MRLVAKWDMEIFTHNNEPSFRFVLWKYWKFLFYGLSTKYIIKKWHVECLWILWSFTADLDGQEESWWANPWNMSVYQDLWGWCILWLSRCNRLKLFKESARLRSLSSWIFSFRACFISYKHWLEFANHTPAYWGPVYECMRTWHVEYEKYAPSNVTVVDEMYCLSINSLGISPKMLQLCSFCKAPSDEVIVTLLVRFSTKLTFWSILFILELACTASNAAHIENKWHAQIGKLLLKK